MVAVKKSALVFLITELYYWQIQVSAVCSNNPTYLYTNDYHNEGKSCKWVENKEDRREKFCKLEEVHENCPITCGICCEDDQFFHFEDIGGEDVHCKWITDNSERKDKWCSESFNGKMIRDSCPYSCDQCTLPHISVLPTAFPSADHCHDDSSYMDENGESCESINYNEELRSTLCQLDEVNKSCPTSCGECCEDDDHFTFNVDDKTHDCDWISTAMLARHWDHNICTTLKGMNDMLVGNACPRSCNKCRDNESLHPTNYPTMTPIHDHCHNNDSFRFKGKSCNWIRHIETRRSSYCKYDDVKDNCPVTCGECCEDNDHYSFVIGDETMKCDGLLPAKATEKYCGKWINKKLVRNECAKSCNYCEGPPKLSEEPSSIPYTLPTSSPSNDPSSAPFETPYLPCLNDNSYRYESKAKKSCKWIKENEERRLTLCELDEVKAGCPVLCGECCRNNELYRHDSNEKKSCEWIKRMDETYLCNVEEVKDNCPSMCGECCMDDNEYTFGVDGVTRDCNWLSQQILAHAPRHWWDENMCNELSNGKKVRDGCTKSCNACGTPPIETLSPSKDPTSNPSASPSSAPTASPSSVPTASPSSAPTASPSSAPTENPSSTPSNKPTISVPQQ